MVTTPSCVQCIIVHCSKEQERWMILWKTLIDICVFDKVKSLGIDSCLYEITKNDLVDDMKLCILLPHRHAGRLHWGKAESIQLRDLRVGQARHYRWRSAILLITPAMCSPSVIRANVRPSQRVNKDVILTGRGSVWFGIVILTRQVQWTAKAFTVWFAAKVNWAREQVQFGSIWRTCICENNKIVIVIIMCSISWCFCSPLNTLITITPAGKQYWGNIGTISTYWV